MDERAGCAGIRELLPELAAGVAVGDERARALAHLGECPACRRELAALSTVADEMLTLAPAVPPPGGFEAAVLAKVAPPPRRRRWRGRALRVALTVLVAAAAGSGVTMQATADDRRAADRCREKARSAGVPPLAERALAAPDGSAAGRAATYRGEPAWLLVVVARPGAAGAYEVHVVTRDGRSLPIGTVPVGGGHGAWGTALEVGAEQVAEVRLTGPAGPPLTAGFR